MNTTEWIKTGILNAEKYSTHFENKIRSEHGLPLRQSYSFWYPQTRLLNVGNTSLYFFVFNNQGKIVPYQY